MNPWRDACSLAYLTGDPSVNSGNCGHEKPCQRAPKIEMPPTHHVQGHMALTIVLPVMQGCPPPSEWRSPAQFANGSQGWQVPIGECCLCLAPDRRHSPCGVLDAGVPRALPTGNSRSVATLPHASASPPHRTCPRAVAAGRRRTVHRVLAESCLIVRPVCGRM